jgi:predicted AlkP superfamily pyrophosphatase or phosphodiesterase
MKRIPSSVAALFSTLLIIVAACGGRATDAQDGSSEVRTNADRQIDAPYVVLVSFDGFRWDYLDRYPTPNFDRVAREGARAERMIPVFPSKTFPTHYTIATGMYAEHHGLVGNNFWDPDKKASYSISNREVVEDGSWYRGEPIWVTAERQGMLAASYFFVGSEADVGGVRPTYWTRYDGSVPNDKRVDAVLDWLARPPETRPHMITLYFSDADDAGHRYGPESEEVVEAVASVDATLGRLLDGLDALPPEMQLYVVLVSDHGMLTAPAAKADLLPLDRFSGVRAAATGPYASLWVDEGGAARIPALRDSIAALLPADSVWARENVPARFHYNDDPRIGDIVIVADRERTVVTPDRIPTRDGFTHGWDNQVLEMGAIFLARGPRIVPGQRIPAFESVNVYPFLAELLGLTPNPEIDGDRSVLAPILSR